MSEEKSVLKFSKFNSNSLKLLLFLVIEELRDFLNEFISSFKFSKSDFNKEVLLITSLNLISFILLLFSFDSFKFDFKLKFCLLEFEYKLLFILILLISNFIFFISFMILLIILF